MTTAAVSPARRRLSFLEAKSAQMKMVTSMAAARVVMPWPKTASAAVAMMAPSSAPAAVPTMRAQLAAMELPKLACITNMEENTAQ